MGRTRRAGTRGTHTRSRSRGGPHRDGIRRATVGEHASPARRARGSDAEPSQARCPTAPPRSAPPRSHVTRGPCAVELLSERHLPPSPSATPTRSSLRGGRETPIDPASEPTSSSTDSDRPPSPPRRRASWADLHNLELETVHHVADTHCAPRRDARSEMLGPADEPRAPRSSRTTGGTRTTYAQTPPPVNVADSSLIPRRVVRRPKDILAPPSPRDLLRVLLQRRILHSRHVAVHSVRRLRPQQEMTAAGGGRAVSGRCARGGRSRCCCTVPSLIYGYLGTGTVPVQYTVVYSRYYACKVAIPVYNSHSRHSAARRRLERRRNRYPRVAPGPLRPAATSRPGHARTHTTLPRRL